MSNYMGELSMPPREYWKQGKSIPEDKGDSAVAEFKTATRGDREQVDPITWFLEKKAQQLRKQKGELDSRIIDTLNVLASTRGIMLAAEGEDRKNAEMEVSRAEQERLKAVEESTILQEKIDETQKRIHRLKTHALNVEDERL